MTYQASRAAATDEANIHQVLHGYDHGHRMLAASCPLPEDDLRLIDRLSDASGARPVMDNNGYLTGYPLPSGSYALATTWYVKDAPRPNVVVTHTLLLSRQAVSVANPGALVELMHPPRTLDEYAQPLSIPERAMVTSEAGEGNLALNVVLPVLAALYSSSRADAAAEVWLKADDLHLRNATCLAIWGQQWPRLRRNFAFCSGALEPRKLEQRTFDLLAAPTSDALASVAQQDLRADIWPRTLDALYQDLVRPSELRAFLRQVGPDSGRRRVMSLFVEAFALASESPDQPRKVLSHVASRAPRPSSMRRLKRTILDPAGLLEVSPSADVLEALLAPDIAECVLASDAHVEQWASAAWEERPQVVLGALLRVRHADAAGSDPSTSVAESPSPREAEQAPTSQPVTAGGLATTVLEDLLLRRSSPEDLALLFAADEFLGVRLLHEHERSPAWWTAWAGLPDKVFKSSIAHLGLRRSQDATILAVSALLMVPGGESRFRRVRDEAGPEAVRALLTALAASGSRDPKWMTLLVDVPDEFVAATRAASKAELALAIDAVPNTALAERIKFETWLELVRDRPTWTGVPRRCAVLFIAAAKDSGAEADSALALAYLSLYAAFAAGEAEDAWRLIEPMANAKHDEWDRCRRLARATAGYVSGKTRVRASVVADLPDGEARRALVREIEELQRKDKHGPSGSSSSPIESLLKLIRPW
jgi:hypothetical protein